MNSLAKAVFFVIAGVSLCLAQPAEMDQPPDKADMQPASSIGHRPPPGPPPMMLSPEALQSVMDEISLSREVGTQISAISESFRSFLDERIIKIQRLELDVREELLKEKPDLKNIQSLIAKKAQVIGEIEFGQIKRDVEIKALLSKDEFERWRSAIRTRIKELRSHHDKNKKSNRASK